jgi:penicillin amidase
MYSDSTEDVTKPKVRSRHRWLRRSLWTLAAIAAILLLFAGCGLLWLHRAMVTSLPQLDGSIHLSGLAAPVTVRRDNHGVPHIQAANLDDLLLAQGYVTAQDRLWQMDMLRRNAAGELAELLGPSLIAHDKAQRIFQFRNVALRIYSSQPEQERHRYEQYAKGVNLFIQETAQDPSKLPAEFRLLHYHPRPWAGSDCMLILTNMVQALDDHWDVKLSREAVASRLHDPKLESDLYPVGSWRDQPPTAAVADMTQPHPAPPPDDDEDDDKTQTLLEKRLPPVSTLRPGSDAGKNQLQPHEDIRALRQLLDKSDCDDCIPGSNEWVLSGKHTASGKPMLSNDMHLELSVPNIWYMADLSIPGMHSTGVTLPGTPFVTAGHNDHVAWGYTALYADVQDLYVEKLDGKGNYAGPNGQWLPLAHASETIHVRWGKDVKLDVQLTAHGPLITPIFKKETRPIALHWTLYDPTLTTIPIYEMNKAENWQQFSAAVGAWCWPTLNLVYSDDAGHIAYHAIGKVPMRPGGLVALPIQDSQHEWQGYIPFDNLPYSVDPPSGLLATANSRVTPNDTKFPITLEWVDPYRAERIYMDLRGRDKLTREDMLSVQTDIYSEVDQELAHRFAYAIDQTAKTSSVDNRLRQAADLLRSWDGRMTTDSAAAAIVYRTRQAFWPLILDPKLGNEAQDYHWSESNFAEEEIIMHGSNANSGAPSPWLPSSYKNWDALLTEAVRRGLDRGKAPGDLAQWSYGQWHVVDLEHPLYQLLPLVKGWSGTGELPLSGDTTTVKQVGRSFGPSQRFTMDWSDPDHSTENIVLGESGDPASPWFRDQWQTYYSGATFALPFSSPAVAAQTTHTLQLVP